MPHVTGQVYLWLPINFSWIDLQNSIYRICAIIENTNKLLFIRRHMFQINYPIIIALAVGFIGILLSVIVGIKIYKVFKTVYTTTKRLRTMPELEGRPAEVLSGFITVFYEEVLSKLLILLVVIISISCGLEFLIWFWFRG
jgi:hypothetical protein